MNILNQLETEPIPIDEEEKRRTKRLLIGILCAVLLTGAVLGGYLGLRKRHERQVAAAAEAEIKRQAPRVEVFVDDALVNGKTTTLGGTVHNISTENLQNIAVELQLRRRVGAGLDTKVVQLETPDLAPDARAHYSIQVATEDYISATFSHVVSGADRAAVPFKALPGNPRPPLDAPSSKTIIVDKRNPGKGDEFINTPNNPGRVP
ncbi:MAG TPA: hypothetical protein VGP81_12300 [Pyrinomonadaceae bacterium]|jgi:hypothetical protein|nr:hypothetical protein [Pyrinomonadaceae bacterium]